MRSSRRLLRGVLARIAAFQRHDLHRRVARLIQEAVNDRAAKQDVPARTRRLAEDDVRDALAPGEINQRVGDVGALQLDHLGAEFLGETQALRERDVIFRVDAARLFARRFDVNGVPVRSQPPGDARSDAQQLLGAAARGDADHHFFGDDGVFQALALAIILRFGGLIFGHLAQRQLAQRREIAFAEEIGERLLDLFDSIDFALAQPRAQRVYRDIDVDTLRTRLRQRKIYRIEKIEQALTNFFRKGNLSALRELALRQVAEDQAAKAQDYREREGLEHAVIPEKVMVCIASRGGAKKLLRVGSRIAGRLASDWYAVYVETPREEPGR